MIDHFNSFFLIKIIYDFHVRNRSLDFELGTANCIVYYNDYKL